MYKIDFFSGIQQFYHPAAGLFSRSRLRSTQGTRLYTMVQVWVPAGLRGACSGRSKSRSLSDQLEPTRPIQTPNAVFILFFTSLCCCF